MSSVLAKVILRHRHGLCLRIMMSTQKGGGEVRTQCDHQAAVIIVEAVDRGEMADGDGGKLQISGCQISKIK